MGKTCLRSQFVHHVFTNAYKATIGGDFITTTVTVPLVNEDNDNTENNEKYTLQVWDTAGQERFNLISQAFYRGSDVCILMYDVTNYESVLSVRDWFSRFMHFCRVDSPGVVIVGNKTDRDGDRCIDRDEVRDVLCRNSPHPSLDSYVANWDLDLIEVSCKLLEAVQQVFQRAAVVASTSNPQTPPVVAFDSIEVNSRSTCAC